MRVLEFLGPLGAAELSSSGVLFASGAHSDTFWRSAYDEQRRLEATLPFGFQAEEVVDLHHRLQDVELLAEGADGRLGNSVWRRRFARRWGLDCAQASRRARLRRELAAHGLELRSDSALCDHYIREGGRSLPGGLHRVVSTMVEMDFFFRETSYVSQRKEVADEIFRRARRDAREAFLAGEENALRVENYLEELGNLEISNRAKSRALSAYVRTRFHQLRMRQPRLRGAAEHANLDSDSVESAELAGPILEDVLAEVPESLRQQARHLCTASGGVGRTAPGEIEESRAAAASRRAQLRQNSRQGKSQGPESWQHDEGLLPHFEAVRQLALRRAGPGVLRMPGSLSRSQRAQLHELAESLGLGHASESAEPYEPDGGARILMIWRQADPPPQGDDETPAPNDGLDE